MLIVLLFSAIIELMVVRSKRLIRPTVIDGISVGLALVSTWLLIHYWNIFSILIVFFMAFRILNLERLTHRLVKAEYIKRVALRASYSLILCQIVIVLIQAIHGQLMMTITDWMIAIAMIDLVAAGIFAHTIDRQGRVTLPLTSPIETPEAKLPTLTVAIPARNETADLEACLQTLIHSRYLKLEILVLDDCSQNTRTPEIIRQFAHDGVRFIAGKLPPDNWLAKNYAYQQLTEEANGEIILFCGVDARFEPDSLNTIVATMLSKQKTMLSVIPRNPTPGRLKLESLLVQPGRYAWELVLPRRWLDRPPVLSSCWVVRRELLNQAGGLAAVHRAILPERYFARYAALHSDGYSLVQSGDQLGLSSVKRFTAQRATAVRIRYPGLHRRIELAALVVLAELGLFVVPYVGLIYGLISHQYEYELAILFGGSCILLTFVYSQVVRITYQRLLIRSLWLFPFAVIYDVGLLLHSLWQYEFREVIWKGRNVCIPVMHVLPSLPKIETSYNHRQHRRRHRRHHHH